MSTLKLALNPSLDEFVCQIAKEEQKHKTVVVRDALIEYKRNRELQALKVAGLKAAISE